ncbi:MAG: aldo/keto reductase, partial [Myxococcota bacterium]|nr:aldo/keto reductase [Myxococcota bacterium]
EELNCSMTQLALAWCVKNPNVSTVLLGATKLRQIEENLGALAVVPLLNDALMNRINRVLDNAPASYNGFGGKGMRDIQTIS